MKVLFDTNVVLDVLLAREPHVDTAARLLSLVDTGRLDGVLYATTVTTVHYLASKAVGAKLARKHVGELLEIFDVACVDHAALESALDLEFGDYEDAVLHEAAKAAGAGAIVTRDGRDFRSATLPVFDPEELLAAVVAAGQRALKRLPDRRIELTHVHWQAEKRRTFAAHPLGRQAESVNRYWEYYTAPFRAYATFTGRATRREFWTFSIVNAVIALLLSYLDVLTGSASSMDDLGLLAGVFALVLLLPSLAVSVRRLHDSNRRGWWVLAHAAPLVGWLIALVQLLAAPTPGENRFGPNPRGQAEVALPSDGGPPFAVRRGFHDACPWCDGSNPPGRAMCQWCQRPYRQPEEPRPPA